MMFVNNVIGLQIFFGFFFSLHSYAIRFNLMILAKQMWTSAKKKSNAIDFLKWVKRVSIEK